MHFNVEKLAIVGISLAILSACNWNGSADKKSENPETQVEAHQSPESGAETPTTSVKPVPESEQAKPLQPSIPEPTPTPTQEPDPENTDTSTSAPETSVILPQPPETPAPVPEDSGNTGIESEVRESEVVLKFYAEFDPMRKIWERDLQKTITLLGSNFYQTVKTYRRPELAKRKDELTEFVKKSAVSEGNKTIALDLIESRYNIFETNFRYRGGPAREFTNLVTREIAHLQILCKDYPETQLSCDIVQKLATQKLTFMVISKWPQASLLPYETMMLNLINAPLNAEQANVAEDFYQHLIASGQ